MTNLSSKSLDQHGITIHWRFWWHLRTDFKPNIVRLQLLHRIEIVRTGDMVMQLIVKWQASWFTCKDPSNYMFTQVCSTTKFYPKIQKFIFIILDILVSTSRNLTLVVLIPIILDLAAAAGIAIMNPSKLDQKQRIIAIIL